MINTGIDVSRRMIVVIHVRSGCMSISSVYCIPSYTDTSCEYSTDVPLFIPLCRTATSSPIHRPAALMAKTTPYVSTPLNPSSPSSHSLPLPHTHYIHSVIDLFLPPLLPCDVDLCEPPVCVASICARVCEYLRCPPSPSPTSTI